jgi:hypothetical protein
VAFPYLERPLLFEEGKQNETQIDIGYDQHYRFSVTGASAVRGNTHRPHGYVGLLQLL